MSGPFFVSTVLLAVLWRAAGHGIALPVTDVAEKAFEAAAHAQALVSDVVDECSSEVSHICSKAHGLEESARCLIQNSEMLTSEVCASKVENAARHFPASFHHKWNNHSEGSRLTDFGKRTNRGCDASSDTLPYIWSYHVHLQWDYLGCKECHETAMNFSDRFIRTFQPDAKMCRRFAFLTDLWNKGSVSPDNIEDHPLADMCVMSTMPPGGPFFHAEKGFAISTTMFHRVVPWLMANRPLNDKLYIMVHPNSGCQYNDLRHWSMWVGPSVGIFYSILEGCVWASCEDEVLGCIAFNHLGKNQGYGTCYQAPTAYGKPGPSLDCKMTIEASSNTTTETCSRPNTTTWTTTSSLPKTMMAGALTKRNIAGSLRWWNRSVDFDSIKYVEVKVPAVEHDQVLIKVTAGALNPCEWKFPMGMESPLDWIPSYPLVLSRDCLGTVVSVGKDVKRLKVGDVVWGNQGPFKQGCASKYAALKEVVMSHAPAKLPAVEAAVLPLVSLTSLDALRFCSGSGMSLANKTLLVLGGSGGVGHVMIQMAKAWGASRVIATCGTDHVAFCSSVGGDRVIDYHKQEWQSLLKERSVDAVFDLVGLGGTGDQAYEVLREDGCFVTLQGQRNIMPSWRAKARRPDIRALFSNTEYWHPEDLDLIRDMVDAGKLKPHIDKTYTWEELGPGFRYLMDGHTTGKISIVPPASADSGVAKILV